MLERGRTLAIAAALIVTAGACGEDNPVDPGNGPSEGDEILSGAIDTDDTLDASLVYVITGIVSVEDGGSLTIPAGTTLVGSTTVLPSALLVRQGGKIFANGTATEPVVFTSGQPAGQRERGDWGGVVINGRSICNFLTQANPQSECVSEGASGEYGANPPVLDDDSGAMTYTRIEFAGYEASFGNELNALTLNAVGSGTELHHIQTHYGLDDGFEWFGGTANLKHALATGISDDSFDFSTGWQGYGQFWIAQQDPADADQGFEVDGNENDSDAQPYTDPMIYNVTLVGGGAGAVESDVGMLLRLGTAGSIFNAIVTGFGDAGVDIDNSETVGRVTVQNSIIGDNPGGDASSDSDGIDEAAILGSTEWNNLVGTDPDLADAFNRAAPDFRPNPGGVATTHTAAAVPTDPFFSAVSFIGGADPAESTPWYTGWTTVAQN